MKLELFKPQDFIDAVNGIPVESVSFAASRRVNQKLNEYIESLPKVYGTVDLAGDVPKSWYSSLGQAGNYCRLGSSPIDYSAYVICIEPIEKRECEHEAVEYEINYSSSQGLMNGKKTFTQGSFKTFGNECKHCGKKLKAKFEVDDG